MKNKLNQNFVSYSLFLQLVLQGNFIQQPSSSMFFPHCLCLFFCTHFISSVLFVFQFLSRNRRCSWTTSLTCSRKYHVSRYANICLCIHQSHENAKSIPLKYLASFCCHSTIDNSLFSCLFTLTQLCFEVTKTFVYQILLRQSPLGSFYCLHHWASKHKWCPVSQPLFCLQRLAVCR